MKNIIKIIGLVSILTSSLFAQKKSAFTYDYEISYQYTFKPNKNDTAKITESMLLYCNDKDFYYTSLKNFERERTIANGGGPQLLMQINSGGSKPSNVTHSIFTADQIVTTLERANNRSFSYEELLDLKWNVLPDTTRIRGYHCQKATLGYGGRKWIAWFSATIPLFMGPYKFNGLPGLILKIADEQNQFNWELTSFRKIATSITWIYSYKTKNHEQITKKEYFNYRIKRIEDPFTYDIMLNPSINKINSPNLDQVQKGYNKKVKSKLVEDNWIEMEL